MLYKSPRGTVDILPEEQKYWRYVENKAVEISRLYGYERLDTPVFEDSGLFTRSIGEGTDIVTKEMYIFKDQSNNSLALRPEGTASVCRAYLEHGMHNRPQPVKLYYLTAIFRYERPQSGRYRQHYQFGCEAIGDIDPALDAEVIEMAWQFFSALGLEDLSLQLNSIGCKLCRPRFLDTLKKHYAEHSGVLCEDCRTRMVKNPLRLLDCKQPACQAAANAAPKSSEHLCHECDDHFKSVQGYLQRLAIPFNINHRLVRGLDYYTRTVFEIQPPEEGSQSALGGGGRYDNLIEELGGSPAPAIGFGSGIERIILNLKKQGVNVPDSTRATVMVAYLGDEAKLEAVKLTSILRRNSIPTVMTIGDKSLKAQLRQANNLNMEHAVIIGEEELKSHTVTLRNMKTSEQQTVAVEKLIDILE